MTRTSTAPVEHDAVLRRVNVDVLCFAETGSDAVGVAINARLSHIDAYLARHLSHPEIRALYFDRVRTAPPDQGATLLRAEISRAKCPLGELLAWLGTAADEDENTCFEACASRHGAEDDLELTAKCRLGCKPR